MKPIRLVADESVDFSIVRLLRINGYDVLSIAESNSSLTDTAVLALAAKNKSLLLTEDKDFGELVFRLKMNHNGILLIRLINFSSTEKANLVLLTLKKHYAKLPHVFSVLDERKIRIRK
jgi:predicted nuclease of predicted toxin-antitoxin system